MAEKEKTQPSEKLDAVLIYLKNSKLAYNYGFGLPRLYDKPKNDIILTNDDILNILDKLERDNLVRIEIMGIGDGNSNSAKHYAINIDGELLLQNGGYTQQLKDNRLNQDKIENDLKISKRNDFILILLSFAVAISTVGLFAVELYNILCQS